VKSAVRGTVAARFWKSGIWIRIILDPDLFWLDPDPWKRCDSLWGWFSASESNLNPRCGKIRRIRELDFTSTDGLLWGP
jgi:hypothetical protein